MLAIVCAGLVAAGCSSSSSGSSGSSSSPSSAAPKGTASVAYASSLQFLNEKVAAPAFTAATGYKYTGRGDSSGALEADIAGGEITPNVFEAVGGDNIMPLEPKFTKWFIPYAGTQMVVAYNPKSKYASDFKAYADGSKPLKGLFTLLQTPGLKLGRTDPNIDPQGRDFIYMLELAQMHYNLPKDTVSKILGTIGLRHIQLLADLRRVLAGLHAPVRPARRVERVHHPGGRAAPALYQAAAGRSTWATPRWPDQYAKATVTIKPPGMPKLTKSGSPQVIDITIIGKPTPAGMAFVKYTLSPAGLAAVQAGRVHADHPDGHR